VFNIIYSEGAQHRGGTTTSTFRVEEKAKQLGRMQNNTFSKTYLLNITFF
jgi:hypothetical protein